MNTRNSKTNPPARGPQDSSEVDTKAPLRESVAEPAALLRLTTQLYWTVTRDVACAINSGQYFEATSAEEAQAKALAFFNRQNGFGPEDDGGFEPVLAYDQAELRWILSGLAAFGNKPEVAHIGSRGAEIKARLAKLLATENPQPQHCVPSTSNPEAKQAIAPVRETTPLPTEHQRQIAKAKTLEAVSGWLEARIDAVFEMADEDEEPEFGARITWRDLVEVREQICGCIADDLNCDLGECVQAILEAELSGEQEIGGGDAPSASHSSI